MDNSNIFKLADNYLKLAKKYNKPRKGMKSRWSTKYKRSIDCNNPKGFSQKAYCARKRRGGSYKSDVNDLEWLDKATAKFKEVAQQVSNTVQQKIEDLKKSYQEGKLLPKEVQKAVEVVKEEGKEKLQEIKENLPLAKPEEEKLTTTTTIPDVDNEIENFQVDLERQFNPQPPIKGDYNSSGGFGVAKPDGRTHDGVDLRSPSGGGTPVYPIEAGKVTKITSEESGENKLGGNSVTIEHLDGEHKSYYAHLQDVHVNVGDMVDKDTSIGTIGNTGNAKHTAPHVHLTVTRSGTKVDPATLFYVPPYSDFDHKTERLWAEPQV